MVHSIQYMRAIAALLVVVAHAVWKGSQYSSSPMSWFNVGGIGVDLFFVISGFIMCHVTYKREVSFLSFMKARFIRILPLYWLLTSMALLIYLFFPEKINSSRGETGILASYFLFPNESRFLVSNGWTLSYEFYFYVIFAIGLFFSNSLKYLLPVVLMLILVISGFIVESDNIQFEFLTNTRLLEFICGICIFFFFIKYTIKKTYSLILIALSLVVLIFINFMGNENDQMFYYLLPVLLFFVGMRGLEDTVFSKQPQGKALRILSKIGDSSYSLYLFHPFALVLASIVLNKLGITAYGYLFVGLLVFISVATGWLVYVYLELKINKVVKRKFT